MKKRKKYSIKLMICMAVIIVCVVLVIVAIATLGKDKGNDIAGSDAVVETTEDNPLLEFSSEEATPFEIETSYGKLLFPDKWNEYITTKIVNEAGCESVQFWFELEGKEMVHIFDITFGGEGYNVGFIEGDNTEIIDVNIVSYAYELGDDWTETEKSILSYVEHDVNYLLENLSSLENYTPAE